MPKYCISDLIIEVAVPVWALHDNLQIFLCYANRTDIYCEVVFENLYTKPLEKADVIIKTSGTAIYEHQGDIHIVYGDIHDIPYYIIARRDWSYVTMYVNPEYRESENEQIVQSVKDGIFAFLRDIVTAALSQKQGLLIHSCTVEWQGKGLVFTAPTGTGKSTHAHLWQQQYNTPIIDGDVIACRVINDLPTVYGLPWCGTSGEFLNHSVPLGAVIFLEQAKENSIKKLDLAEAFTRLTARCFLLRWDAELTNQALNTVQNIIEKTDCYLLKCRPDLDAVELVKKCLE